ncbi:hypothetical protein HK100_002881 [Physocladia obscura]|uniref:Uncharacterized protein n=1 Tax=Physocladia obscura TaxID=109957 RepID=A0AAD5XDJ4_9FUNG|nr:hypothetical protein HK100_002881 [Physocladia obscura]
MTFITVLVQHAWAMQPSSKPDKHEPKKPEQINKKVPTVRVSVPSSVAEFVRVFNEVNGANDEKFRALLDVKALDVMSQLEDLVLASSIRDEMRQDVMRNNSTITKHQSRMLRGRNKAAENDAKRGANRFCNDEETSNPRHTIFVRTQTRRYSAQARRSVLALATARSRLLRAKCMLLLIEALDTNELGSDDGEVASLLLLVKELGDVLEGALQSRGRRQSEIKRPSEHPQLPQDDMKNNNPDDNKSANNKNETGEENNDAELIPMDDFLEKISICVNLAVQRLEYACDIKSFFIPGEVQGAFERLFNENLYSLKTNDPFTLQMIINTVETMQWLMATKIESEELMATPVAMSLLSQIIRMTPNLDTLAMLEPFEGILNDLNDKQEWHLGCKFLKLVATGANFDQNCLTLFLALIEHIDTNQNCPQWLFTSITCLGIVTISSPSSQIRQNALETGLLRLIDRENMYTRAAAATCLVELYAQKRGEASGMLAFEVLRERRAIEKDELVLKILVGMDMPASLSIPSTPPLSSLPVSIRASRQRRVFYLFKYVCLSLAETYSDSQSRYAFLRKFLKSNTVKHGKSVFNAATVTTINDDTENLKLGNADMSRNSRKSEQIVKRSKYVWNSRSLSVFNANKKMSQRAIDLLNQASFDEKEDAEVILSISPYHQNYKLIEVKEGKIQDEKNCIKPSMLNSHSYVTGSGKPVTDIANPANGSVNRRKLFNHHGKHIN